MGYGKAESVIDVHCHCSIDAYTLPRFRLGAVHGIYHCKACLRSFGFCDEGGHENKALRDWANCCDGRVYKIIVKMSKGEISV